MGIKKLQQFIKELSREELEEQVADLYHRYKDVKQFYDFSFNPNEDKLWKEAKSKIRKEYFPQNGRKPKKRPSVAQKIIRKYQQLEMNPEIIADIMFYTIETALLFNADFPSHQKAFFKSFQNSIEAALSYLDENGYKADFEERIQRILEMCFTQDWPNAELIKTNVLLHES